MLHAYPDQEIFEAYTLGQLRGAELNAFEERLLGCAECRDRQAEADLYVASMRAALRSLPTEQSASRLSWLGRLLAARVPAPAWAGTAVAALALGIGLVSWQATSQHEDKAPPVEITLHAIRGPEGASTAAARPLLLHLDVEGLPSFESYAVSIVAEDGDPVFQESGVRGQREVPIQTAGPRPVYSRRGRLNPAPTAPGAGGCRRECGRAPLVSWGILGRENRASGLKGVYSVGRAIHGAGQTRFRRAKCQTRRLLGKHLLRS